MNTDRIESLSPQQPVSRPPRAGTKVPGHALIAGTLKTCGITHVYGITGTPVDETLGACAAQGIRVIGARHQQGATLMATAHNYVAGALRAAVIVSAGPAVTNCATGLLVGHDNAWPLLVIGGRRPLAQRSQGAFQELDGAALFTTITKHSALVARAGEIPPCLSWACREVMAGRPGPVYMDIAEEALGGLAVPSTSPNAIAAPASFPDPQATEAAAVLITRAQRPVLLFGKGARWSEPWAELRQLVEDFRVPFAASPMGRGFLPDSHPLNLAPVRAAMLASADTVVVVGARLDWTFRYGAEIALDAQIIRIDLDPAEAMKTLGRGVGITVDAKVGMQGLLSRLTAMRKAGQPGARDEGWLRKLEARREQARERAECLGEDDRWPPHPARWLRAVRTALPENAVTVLDGNICMVAAQALLPAEFPVSRLTPGSNGCMGVGVPFALGARLARPDRPVVAVCGDYAVGLNLMELETAVRYRVPMVIVVANNGGIGGAARQRAHFSADHPDRVSQFQDNIRYDRLMQDLGGWGIRAERPEEVVLALRQALDSGNTALIDVVTDPDAPLP